MPEGPEVWILSKAINNYYDKNLTTTLGKHLIIKGDKIDEDWSFGLNGKVKITDDNKLTKFDAGWLNGNKEIYVEKNIGLDWITSDSNTIINIIQEIWQKSRKKLGTLLLEQSNICGIGVAWGSEILFEAGLRPELKACEQKLDNLGSVMIKIRDKIITTYLNEINKLSSKEEIKQFINDWFHNLYEVREMNIYKKGLKIEVSGRSWWV